MKSETKDRITVSLSKKIGLSQINVFVSYGSDLQEKERLDDAFERVEKRVVKEFKKFSQGLK